MSETDDPTAATSSPAPELWSSRPRRRWLHVTIAVVLGAVVVAWALAAGSKLGDDPQSVESPLLGASAPQFDLPLLDGDGSLSNSDLAGSVYIVNFWASWCVPCRDEAPVLQSFHERWSDSGVVLIGVVYDDRESNAQDFRDEFGLTFPQLMDPDGRTALDFGVRGIPETYIVDSRGIVMAKFIGAVGPTTLDDALAQIGAGQTVAESNDDYRTGPNG